MRIHELIWPQDQIDHIARHNVALEEVEEVCFGRPMTLRAKSKGSIRYIMCLGRPQQGAICSAWSSSFLKAGVFPSPPAP